MFNSKLTKLAAAVALTAAAGSASANDIDVVATADVANGTDTVTAITNLTVASQLTAGASHTVATATANYITYDADTTGIPVNGFIRFDFTNGGIADSANFDLVRQINAPADLDETSMGSVFSKTTDSTDGFVTSITFQLTTAVDLGDVLVLSSTAAVGDGDDTFDGTEVVFETARDLADEATISVSATTLTPSLVEFAAGAVAATPIFTVDEGYDVTAITSVTSSVDFAGGGTDFITTGVNSDALNVGVAAAALSEPVALNASDTFEVTVSAPNCESVADSVNSVEFGHIGGGNEAVATAHDYANCTWTFTQAANGAVGAEIVAGTADVRIITDNTTDIISTDWTTTVAITDELTNESTLTTSTSHNWVAEVAGDAVTVPYMLYIGDGSSNWSQVTFANQSATDRRIAVEVTLHNASKAADGSYDNTAVVYSNYFLGTVPANGMFQATGGDVIDAIIEASGDTLLGYNDTMVALDKTANYHMSVKFTFDGESSVDLVSADNTGTQSISTGDIAVSGITVSGNARYNLEVVYQDEQ